MSQPEILLRLKTSFLVEPALLQEIVDNVTGPAKFVVNQGSGPVMKSTREPEPT